MFIIAEIGYNFHTLEEAKASIDAAMSCGVDAVKFQTFRAETVTSQGAAFPTEAGSGSQYEEFKRYELSKEAHRVLFDYARQRGVVAFSTPSYFDDVDLLEGLDVPAYKIGADDLTTLPFITYGAEKGNPVILSTGMGTMEEVAAAVDAVRAGGNEQLVLLHCLSNYPVKDLRMVNLRAMQTMRSTFDVPVGFSDHTTTLSVSLGAVALGASVIERHFTIDKSLPSPDAYFSADPPEMTALVQGIRELERALGDGMKRPAQTEEVMRSQTRKSAVARRDIQSGELLTIEDIIIKRPGTGIPPAQAHVALPRRAKARIPKDAVITFEQLE